MDTLLRRFAASLVGAALASTATAATIRGQVVDAVDATPLADVAIRVNSATAPSTQTDAQGRFEIEAPGPEIRIQASAAPRLYLDASIRLPDVGADVVVEGVTLSLGRAARVSGKITRADGSAVAFAEVALVGPPPDPNAFNPARIGTTDAEGRYRIDRVIPGSYVVHARNAGILIGQATGGVECPQLRYCPRERIDTIRLEGFDEIEGVDFTLRPGAILAGTIRGSDGSRMFGSVTAFDAALRPIAFAFGPDWELPAVPLGTYRLAAGATHDGRFLPVVHPGIPCEATGCDLAAGDEVDAVVGITLIDIVQPRAAEVRFPVSLGTSPRPPPPVRWDFRVEALRADPVLGLAFPYPRCFVQSVGVSSPAVCFLPGGRYRFEARSTGWRDQRYATVDCEPAGCGSDAGQIVDVVAGAVRDMPALVLSTIGGVAVDVRGGGQSLWGVVVEAYDATGELVSDSRRNMFGSPVTLDLEPGAYWIRTRNAPGFVDRLYPDVPCTPDCALSTGLPVVVEGDGYQSITLDLGRVEVLLRDGVELFPIN